MNLGDDLASPPRHVLNQGGEMIGSAGAADYANMTHEVKNQQKMRCWRRVDFMNWITHDNISFPQAASERLYKAILGGGPHVKYLLPCERTVRS
jgi:hypothetical protein